MTFATDNPMDPYTGAICTCGPILRKVFSWVTTHKWIHILLEYNHKYKIYAKLCENCAYNVIFEKGVYI